MCPCSDWKNFGISCRHAIAVTQEAWLVENYTEFLVFAFDPIYLMSNYVAALESAKIKPI